jgi:biotin operon repressor
MAGAKHKMLELLKENVGKEVSRDLLSEAAGTHEWARSIRTLREEGWEIETTKAGYILHSLIQTKTIKTRFPITTKLRYQVIQRDNSKCQRCGRTII